MCLSGRKPGKLYSGNQIPRGAHRSLYIQPDLSFFYQNIENKPAFKAKFYLLLNKPAYKMARMHCFAVALASAMIVLAGESGMLSSVEGAGGFPFLVASYTVSDVSLALPFPCRCASSSRP